MKKLFLIILTALLFGCSSDSESNYLFEILAVESVEMPESFTVGNQHPINITFKLPSDCHNFNGFYYDKLFNIRVVAVQAIVEQRLNCLAYDEESANREATLTFLPIETGTYIFRFFKGKDDEGQNIFEEFEIEVNAN
jgi:hypothetical protein